MQSHPHKNQTILVVDDDELTLSCMSSVLREWQYTTLEAASAAAALEIAAAHSLDAVVTDLNLGDGSGIDLMRELNLKYGLLGVAVTGNVFSELGAEFICRLIKPLDWDKLTAAVATACHREKGLSAL
jgi:CheY-like chemotaxis protein